jgi:DNA-binding MarR family transcriptional regulator
MEHSPIRPRQEASPSSTPSPAREPSRLEIQLTELRERLLKAPEPERSPAEREPALSRLVQEVLRSRRRREKTFGIQMFGEPAWDLLLELFAAESTGQRLSVVDACHATAVPASTAMRWIETLEKLSWVRRVGHPSDPRRSWLFLTERASITIEDYFRSLPIRPA